MLVRAGRLELTLDVSDWIAKCEAAPFIRFVPVDNRIALRSVELPSFPHSDPADRIIVADYSLAGDTELPSGRTRVATVHVRLDGFQTPDFELQLIAAGNAEGQRIPAEAVLELQDGRAP